MPLSAQAKSVFLEALETTPANRAAFLETACAGDRDLRRRVDALLAAHGQNDPLLDQPAVQHLASPDAGSLNFLKPSTKPGSLGTIDHYEVLEVVGRGGMGTVFRAFDEKLHRVVAIKVLNSGSSARAEDRQRFVREARAAAAVAHDHVISIHAVEDAGPVPYLVMQYISGCTLQQKLESQPRLNHAEVLRIGLQIAEGLAAAHAQGLIHRDIKPANILLENGIERVKITDFGLARGVDEAESGTVIGTPSYMSPEQATGAPLDVRSDLFSLGSVLFALVTGQPPFRAESLAAMIRQIRETDARRLRTVEPLAPEWLDSLVARLLARNPADRPVSAVEVATVLRKQLAQLQAGAMARAPSRRKPALVGLTIVAFAGAIGGIWWMTRPHDSVGPQASSATQRPSSGTLVIAPARTLTGHTAEVMSVAISPDRKTVASAGRDRTIILWNTDTWQQRVIASGHPGDIVKLAFAPDSIRLASVCSSPDACRVRVWNVAAAAAAGEWGGASPGIWALAWSPDGQSIACGGWDHEVRILDATTGEERWVIRNTAPRHVRTVGFSPNGELLVSGGTGRSRLWKVASGEEVPSEFPEDVCPSFLKDDTVIGWTHGAGRITVCDVPSGMVRRAWKAHPGLIQELSPSPDGRFVASIGEDGVARIWTPGGTEMAALTGHRGNSLDLAFSADGAWLVTAGHDDFTVRVWELPEFCRIRK